MKHCSELFIPHWVSEHVPSSGLWPRKPVFGVHQVWFNGVIGKKMVGMIAHRMYVIWFAEDKPQWAHILTHSFVTKFRKLQDLAGCPILCYLPWSPWKRCLPPPCNSQSEDLTLSLTLVLTWSFSQLQGKPLREGIHCCDTKELCYKHVLNWSKYQKLDSLWHWLTSSNL